MKKRKDDELIPQNNESRELWLDVTTNDDEDDKATEEKQDHEQETVAEE